MKKLISLLAVLVLALGCLTAAHAEILPPYGEGQIGYFAAILCAELSLRESPDPAAKVVKTLKYGDFLLMAEDLGDGWARCTLGDAEDSPRGYVLRDYIAVDPAWYRTEGPTPVYAWDDTAAPRVALLDADTKLAILREDADWLIVSLRGAVGWIQK